MRILRALALFAAGSSLLCAQGRERGFAGSGPIFAALDADRNNILSAPELEDASVVLKKLDRDGDGRLTRDELIPGPGVSSGANSEEMVNTLMDLDKNGDGKLAKDEVPERMQGLFERGDGNKDGVLTKEEVTKLVQAQSSAGGPGGEGRRMDGRGRRGGFGRQGGFPRGDQVFTALDANSDGVLSPDEVRNAPSALLRLDGNGDGALTTEEIRSSPTGTAI